MPLRQELPVDILILIQADRHNHHIRQIVVHLQQASEALNARRAPRSPEIQYNHLSPQLAQVHRTRPITHDELWAQPSDV